MTTIARLQEYVSRQAERRPEAVAVVMKGVTRTYGELEAESNRLARALRAAGCRPGDRVGFLLPKSPQAVVAMLAILKADGVYVPIDVDNPAARVRKIVQASEPRVLLGSGAAAARLDALAAGAHWPSPRIGWLDDAEWSGEHVRPAFDASDLASLSAEASSGAPSVAASFWAAS